MKSRARTRSSVLGANSWAVLWKRSKPHGSHGTLQDMLQAIEGDVAGLRACGIRSFARRGDRSRRSCTGLGLCLVGRGRLGLAPTRLLFPSHCLLALSLQPFSNLGQNPLALVVSAVAMTMMVRRESRIIHRSNRWRSSCRQSAAQSASGSRWTALLAMVRIVFDIVLGDRIGNLHGCDECKPRLGTSFHIFLFQYFTSSADGNTTRSARRRSTTGTAKDVDMSFHPTS